MISKLKDISALIKQAKSTRHSGDWVDVGPVTRKQAQTILENTGIDVTGYKRVIEMTDIRHILKSHGLNSGDKYPIDIDELLLIPFILAEPDKVYKSRKKTRGNSLETIVSVREIGDKYLYVEEVRTGRKKLSLKTFYKKKMRK